jgi:hypothetical protein
MAQAQQQQPAQTALTRVVDYVEKSSEALEKAAARAAAEEQMEKAAAELIPGIVDTLASIRVPARDGALVPLLEPGEKQACADALRDRVSTMHILQKVAAHLQRAQAGPDQIGSGTGPAREKQAGVDSPYAGRRDQRSAAWDKFQRDIMGI